MHTITPINRFATSDGTVHDTYEDAVRHNAHLIILQALIDAPVSSQEEWWFAKDEMAKLLTDPDSELSVAIRTAHLSLAGIDHPRPAEEESEAPTELSGEGFEHLFLARNQPE